MYVPHMSMTPTVQGWWEKPEVERQSSIHLAAITNTYEHTHLQRHTNSIQNPPAIHINERPTVYASLLISAVTRHRWGYLLRHAPSLLPRSYPPTPDFTSSAVPHMFNSPSSNNLLQAFLRPSLAVTDSASTLAACSCLLASLIQQWVTGRVQIFDLHLVIVHPHGGQGTGHLLLQDTHTHKIGRASCRERV